MAAIATIADAVPLRGENRAIAALGLRELRRPVGTGLRALLQAAAIDPTSKPLTGFDIAFRLAPRINAAGRMDVASEIVELFCTRDAARANELATKLESLNRQRRDAEAEALAIIDARLADDATFAADRLLVVDGDGWHRGVIGILASRVVERTAKPAIVISVEDGVAHGSGRSVDGFPLLEAIETCGDLFTRFGGHAFAVGFAMPADRLPELRRRVNVHAHARLAGIEPEQVLKIHAELPLDRITPVLAGWMHKLEPLGHGNPEPVFVARRVRVASMPRLMKDRHIRLELAQDGTSGGVMRCVGWDWAGRCTALELTAGSVIDVAYRIRENDHPDFGGIEIEIAGLQPAEA
jgi:single-stranded-DNA-specific exonuclease